MKARVDCNFFGPDGEWEGIWEIFCRNIKEFYWLTPPPRSHLPCYSNYKRSHLCSVILPLFFFSGWMWCYRLWAFKELCSSRNCWKREWHGSFHFHFFSVACFAILSFEQFLFVDFNWSMLLFYLQMTITDNDLIEKSNLNRQFLFRPHHIQVIKAFHS